MIFWVLLGIVIVVPIIVGVFQAREWGLFSEGFLGWLTATCLSVAASFVILGVLNIFIPAEQWYETEKSDLRALDLGNSSEGRYYLLGSGYSSEFRTLNYIKETSGGWNEVESVKATDSRIFEGAEDPHVLDYSWYEKKPWLFPFNWHIGHTYDFHIPEGSIVEEMTLDNSE